MVVAGGMESMTNAPHMVQARTGIRYGDGQLVDHMAWDGLTNPYDGKSMGVFGELCADKYHFTREDQDAFAIESVNRAKAAQANVCAFADEIVPVTVNSRKGDVQVDTDEQPGRSECRTRFRQPEVLRSARKTGPSPRPAPRAFPTAPPHVVLLSG